MQLDPRYKKMSEAEFDQALFKIFRQMYQGWLRKKIIIENDSSYEYIKYRQLSPENGIACDMCLQRGTKIPADIMPHFAEYLTVLCTGDKQDVLKWIDTEMTRIKLVVKNKYGEVAYNEIFADN